MLKRWEAVKLMELNLKYINKILNNIIKKSKGSIIFSEDKVIILEEEKIFQEIDEENVIPSKALELYIKKIKRFSQTDIFIQEGYFKTVEIRVIKDEVSEKNLEKYIELELKEILGTENSQETEDIFDEYFIKYFKNPEEEEIYTVYILERNFIEDLVEFFLKNKLNTGKIYLNKENDFCIDDYDLLLKRGDKFSINKKAVAGAGLIFLCSFMIKIYDYNLREKIREAEKSIVILDDELNTNKITADKIEKEIEELKIKIKKISSEKEYFQEKILKILEIIPDEITAENIYYEKGFLNITGISQDETSLFYFLSVLEKNPKVLFCRYDYIQKEENRYKFLMELKI